MVTAAIRFTQNGVTSAAGQAMLGATGLAVSAANADDTGVVSWAWTLVSVPIGSALVAGTAGVLATFNFTPDAVYGYLVKLTVVGGDGSTATDERVFGVPDAGGYVLPAHQASGASHNFPTNTRGWAGTSTVKLFDKIIIDLFADIAAANAAIAAIPALPAGTVYQHLENNGGAWISVDDITLPKANGAMRTIKLAPTTEDANAGLLFLKGGDAAAAFSRNGGEVDIYAGNGGGMGGNGGDLYLYGGYAPGGNGNGGNFEAGGGNAHGSGTAGEVYIAAGSNNFLVAGGAGGPSGLYAGDGYTFGGNLTIGAGSGTGDPAGTVAGNILIEAGHGKTGGTVVINANDNATMTAGTSPTGCVASLVGGEGIAGWGVNTVGGIARIVGGEGLVQGGATSVGGVASATGGQGTTGGSAVVTGGVGTVAAGGNATLVAGQGVTPGTTYVNGANHATLGGQVWIQGGEGTDPGGTGGALYINGGTGAGVGGNVNISGGAGTTGGGGALDVGSGNGTTGGDVVITAGNGSSAGGGNVKIYSGNTSVGGMIGANPAQILIGGCVSPQGGNISLVPGEGDATHQGVVYFGNYDAATNPNGIYEIHAKTPDANKPGLRWNAGTGKWQLSGTDGVWHDISFV